MKRIAMLVMACAFVLSTMAACSNLCCDPCKEDCCNPCDPCASPCDPCAAK